MLTHVHFATIDHFPIPRSGPSSPLGLVMSEISLLDMANGLSFPTSATLSVAWPRESTALVSVSGACVRSVREYCGLTYGVSLNM